ncbi:MAG: hypothetical protein FWC75_07760 [Oscillospiraceae bacterium]|nr:hypothetical protein [Oscillospiraceae bacterium]
MYISSNILRVVFLIFLLAIFVGSVVLQVFLSKRENRWLGLILPFITFAISVTSVLGMTFYQSWTFTESLYINGDLVTTVTSESGHSGLIPGAVTGAINTFLLMNIPTAAFLVVYASARSKKKRTRDVEKMSVQDL